MRKIDKKIIVSIHKFQADAVNAAEDFNILLYAVNELKKEDISDILLSTPIRSIGSTMVMKTINLILMEFIEDPSLEKYKEIYDRHVRSSEKRRVLMAEIYDLLEKFMRKELKLPSLKTLLSSQGRYMW